MFLLSSFGAIAAARAQEIDDYGDAIRGIPGRVSWWRLGQTADDEEDRQDGSYQGSVTLNQAPLPGNTGDSSVLLDGTTGHVFVEADASHDLATGTLLTWFKPSSLAADFGIISKNAGGLNDGDFFAWYRTSDDTLRIAFQHSVQGETSIIRAGKLTAGATHCLVVRWGDGTPFDVWLAKNGVLEYLGAHQTAFGTLAGNSMPLLIGRTNNIGGDFFFPGIIDDTILWSRRLADPEVEDATQATLPETGTYEPTVTSRSPLIYLKLSETSGISLADSSGNGRDASIAGNPTFGVGAAPSGVAGSNTAIDFGGAADAAITHDAGLEVGECAMSCWVKWNTLADDAVAFAKDDGGGMGVSAVGMADGTFKIIARVPWKTVEVRTRPGVLIAGQWHHIWVSLGRDGVWGAVGGQHTEDGYPNVLHWYGLKHSWRGIQKSNTVTLRLAKAGWSSRADVALDEFAFYGTDTSANRLGLSDAQTLAQSGSVSALTHSIWGNPAQQVNRSSFASLQAAVDSVSAAGGGRVFLNAGTFSESVVLKNNVEIVGQGSGSTTINGQISSSISESTLTDPGGSVSGDTDGLTADGDTSFNISNTLAVGDIFRFKHSDPIQRRWVAAGALDSHINDMELLPIASRTAGSVTFDRPVYFDYPSGSRDEISAWTPVKNVGVRGVHVNNSSNAPIFGIGLFNARFKDVTTFSNNASSSSSSLIWDFEKCVDVQLIDCAHEKGASWGSRTAVGLAHGMRDIVIMRHTCTPPGSALPLAWREIDSGGSSYGMGGLRCEIVDVIGEDTQVNSTPERLGFHGVVAECRYIGGELIGGGIDVCGYRVSCEGVVFSPSAMVPCITMWDGGYQMYFKDLATENNGGAPWRWFYAHGDIRTTDDDISIQNSTFINCTNTGTPANMHRGHWGPNNSFTNVDDQPPDEGAFP